MVAQKPGWVSLACAASRLREDYSWLRKCVLAVSGPIATLRSQQCMVKSAIEVIPTHVPLLIGHQAGSQCAAFPQRRLSKAAATAAANDGELGTKTERLVEALRNGPTTAKALRRIGQRMFLTPF